MQENDNINTKIDFTSGAFKKYLKNTSWLLSERITRIAINFFITIYIIRFLGPGDFGLLSYAISFAALFAAISTLGMDNIIVRELVKEPEKRDTYLGSVFLMKIAGAVISFIMILFAVLLTGDNLPTIILILLVASSTLFQSFNVIDFYFQSRVLSKYPVIVQFVTAILVASIKFLLIKLNADLWLFAAAVTVESLFWAIGFIWVYKFKGFKISDWKFSKDISLQLIRDSWPLILSGLTVAVYAKIDQVMIKNMLNNEQLGYYAAAVRLSEAWYFIPMALTASLFPAIINAKKASETLYNNRMQKLYDILAWMAIGIAVPVTVFSEDLVRILLGQEYIASASILTIHIWAGIAVFLGVASSQFLVAENLTKLSFYRTLIGMIMNVILNIILIPKYGIIGAAVATLISYTVAVVSIGIDRRLKVQIMMFLKAILFITIIKRILDSFKKYFR